jgi:hypothetical protein
MDMARVADVVHITRGADSVGVPDPGDPRSLEESTRLIWTRVHALQAQAPGRPFKRDGVPGRLWNGSLTSVINDLWPELSARNLISTEEAQEIRKALHRYVTTSGVMVCLDAGKRRAVKPTWWISDHCNPVVVVHSLAVEPPSAVVPLNRPVPVAAATPTGGEAPPSAFPCRYTDDNGVACGHAPFSLVRIRARHEQAAHGLVFQADGSVIRFNPTVGIREEEIREIIVQVARASGGIVTATTAFKEGKRKDPRITKLSAHAVLAAMQAEGLLVSDPERTTSRCEYFRLTEKLERESATVSTDGPERVSSPAERMVEQLNTTQEVLGLVFDDLRKIVTNEFSDIRLSATTELREENTALKENLRVVTEERDVARARLGAIEQMFRGA